MVIVRNHVTAFYQFCQAHAKQFNLFFSGSQNNRIVKIERRSTWLYVFLLILSATISASYYSLVRMTVTIDLKSPSFDNYLAIKNFSSLTCPCSTLAIKFNRFTSIFTTHHPVCSSDFTSDRWIEHSSELYEQLRSEENLLDIYRILVFQFVALRDLCELAKQTISYEIESFQQTDFIQSTLIPEIEFNSKIHSIIDTFIFNTKRTFSRTVRFSQDIVAQSMLFTGGPITSFQPNHPPTSGWIGAGMPHYGIRYTFLDGFRCTCSSSTATKCIGFATLNSSIVPGFLTGCYMFSALLNSTLEAFANQSFINALSYSIDTFEPLNISDVQETIEYLLNEMFVKEWSTEISFRQYYHACKPDTCQYTNDFYYGFLQVVTRLIGLMGGLASVLRTVCPLLVQYSWLFIDRILKRQSQTDSAMIPAIQTNEVSIGIRTVQSIQYIKYQLIGFNLFKKSSQVNDENTARQQIYSTRLYLFLLFASISIITTFASLGSRTIIKIVSLPTLETYTDLYDRYPITLDCPCDNIAISYKAFISRINPQYHEVCSSDFVSTEWIKVRFHSNPDEIIPTHDFRYQSEIYFQLLATLCRAAKELIDETLESFYHSRFVNSRLLTPKSFHNQVQLAIEDFRQSMSQSFQNTIQAHQLNQEVNLFITGVNSEFRVIIRRLNRNPVHLRPALFRDNLDRICNYSSQSLIESCQCVASSYPTCFFPTVINAVNAPFRIRGMWQSWFPLQALLHSTLECFYDEQCFSEILRFISSSQSLKNFTLLKGSSSSHTAGIINYERIEAIAYRLFVENWENSTSFESYFENCNPSFCQYSYTPRFEAIYIITVIIGLIGGLNVTLRFFTPILIKIGFWAWVKFKTKSNNTDSCQGSSSTNNQDSLHKGQSSTEGVELTYSPLKIRAHKLFMLMKKHFIELNLFPEIPFTNDPQVIRNGRHKTVVYLILFSISIIIIVIYGSLKEQTITEIAIKPSAMEFIQLQINFPSTIRCPCKHSTFKYQNFILRMKPYYHEVCGSIFLMDPWLDSLESELAVSMRTLSRRMEFGSKLRTQFTAILRLCHLSGSIINSSLLTFAQTDMAAIRALSPDEFSLFANTIFNEFKRKTANQLKQEIHVMQMTNQANQIATLVSSNWLLNQRYAITEQELEYPGLLLPVWAQSMRYGTDDCSCGLQSKCTDLRTIDFRAPNRSEFEVLPGFLDGCLTMNAMLQSSFACLYNQSCLDLMQAAIYFSKPVPVKVLMNQSHWMPNTTIFTIMDELFVENWDYQVSFELFYEACSPEGCQYSYTIQYHRAYVLATLIGLIGGLASGLRFLVNTSALIIYRTRRLLRQEQETLPVQKPVLDSVEVKSSSHMKVACIHVSNQDHTKDFSRDYQTDTTLTESETNRKREPLSLNISWKTYATRGLLILLILTGILLILLLWLVDLRNDPNHFVSFISTTTITRQTSTATTMSSVTNNSRITLEFQQETYPTGRGPKTLITADFNEDSNPDLAVTNFLDDTISILLGRGDGQFIIERVYATGIGSNPWGLTLADFNNDNLTDLAVTLPGFRKIGIFFGQRGPALFSDSFYSFDYDNGHSIPGPIEAGDLDHDGFPDLFVCTLVDEDWSQSVIYWNRDSGISFNDYNPAISSYIGEINAVTMLNFHTNDRNYGFSGVTPHNYFMTVGSILTSDGLSFESNGGSTYGFPSLIISGRFNSDDVVDLALISNVSDTLQIFLGIEFQSFTRHRYSTLPNPTSLARIRFNDDEIDDVAVQSCNQKLTVFIGTDLGIYHQYPEIFLGDSIINSECARSMIVGDFNKDNQDDVAFIDPNAEVIRIFLGKTLNY